jgi:hypothetical protein
MLVAVVEQPSKTLLVPAVRVVAGMVAYLELHKQLAELLIAVAAGVVATQEVAQAALASSSSSTKYLLAVFYRLQLQASGLAQQVLPALIIWSWRAAAVGVALLQVRKGMAAAVQVVFVLVLRYLLLRVRPIPLRLVVAAQ